jgi:exonuclease SbcD
VTALPLSSGIPLQRWTCPEGLEQVWQRITEQQGSPAWVDLEVHVPQFISNEEIARLRQAWPKLVNIRTVLPSQEVARREERLASLGLPEIFDRFYRAKRAGAAPPDELVKLFVQLANAVSVREGEDAE